MTRNIYLASASPRRKELLELTGIVFTVRPLEDVDEAELLKGYDGDVAGRAEHLAREKAKIALGLNVPGVFITADTLVIADDGQVLGKPRDVAEAEMFLDKLAGNWHTVATGVAVAERQADGRDRIDSVLETTRVKFAPMTEREIGNYIATGEPFDKAGGYGIQGHASVFIERIEGDYFNVVGFPLHAFWNMWKKFSGEGDYTGNDDIHHRDEKQKR